ncbi:GDSL-like Lipase/Acylhydrolase-domain-containing protein [Radiomyces spectabilis]|uniref:GDSL-like Lipase/Acylhydrolase-domain-containing protein n=1 Tax=Radiomyces spectabilis TaxID=64574 RepID=UPI0022206188|nr:GDSL-like Lipase/Acylhydrolase-domain-containing protein [Radiomyces spectabilis]KAI8380991.1 GDSL-like Lipase/Acylhydrolase-domain-containing protein [Radiomyces spectabilis]
MHKAVVSLALLQIPLCLAASIKNLVVFGDSYSDVGNSQRWSNGPLWSENVAAGWNASLFSFAYSGAVCDNNLYPEPVDTNEWIPSIKDQIEAYYNLQLNHDPEETAFAIWVGVNDIHRAYEQQQGTLLLPDFRSVADCIGQQLRSVRKVFNSNHLILFNVPPLEKMPYFADTDLGESRNRSAIELNKLLQKDVVNLNKHHHALELDMVDVHSLIRDITADPFLFDFSNADSAYFDREFTEEHIDEYVWWDRTHLTASAHRIIANSILMAGSFMPATSVSKDIVQKIETPDSLYRSQVYHVSPHAGVIERLVEELNQKPVVPPPQQALEDEDEPYTLTQAYGLLSIGALLCVAFVVWIKRQRNKTHGWNNYSAFGRSSNRGRFVPLHNSEMMEA